MLHYLQLGSPDHTVPTFTKLILLQSLAFKASPFAVSNSHILKSNTITITYQERLLLQKFAITKIQIWFYLYLLQKLQLWIFHPLTMYSANEYIPSSNLNGIL